MTKRVKKQELDFTPLACHLLASYLAMIWWRKLLDGTNTKEDDRQIVAALKIIKNYELKHSVQHPLPTKEK